MAEPRQAAFTAQRCADFLQGTTGAPTRAQLLNALHYGVAPTVPHRALDLGCGPGREVLELVRAGFEVVAIDPYPQMIELTRELLLAQAPHALGNVALVQATLEEFAPELRIGSFGLVHAGFVLPFVHPQHFQFAFERLLDSIAGGGLFTGQFFGPDDEFLRESGGELMTSHTASDVDTLLCDFDILSREEVNREGHLGRGKKKWWHVHHVIARRRGSHC